MKVLHTIPGLSLNSGGPSTCTYSLLKGLNKLGVHADILTLSPPKTEEIVGTDSFIKRVDFDAVSPLLYSRNILKYLREHTDYDIYHANALWTLPSHETLRIAHKQNKPAVLTPHGMLYPQALQVSRWKKRLISCLFQRKDLKSATCLQATCMAEAHYIRELGIETPVAVIPNGLDIRDIEVIERAENPIRRLAFVGRLHPIKNIEMLLNAWLLLGKETLGAELFIVGNGEADYELALKSFVEMHQISNVKFVGYLKGEAFHEMLSSLDYLVLPSKSENFGMVVAEALAHRVPVIASKGTPWKELEVYHCGWWIDRDTEALSEAIRFALRLSEQKRIEMGESGYQLIHNRYTIEEVAKSMKALYEWILSGYKKPDFVID